MNALIRKEIRLILPAWIAALVLSVAPVWFISARNLVGWQNQGAAIACYCFALGAIFLGLATIGQECALGTFSFLLAQPVPRARIWRVKGCVLAGALISTLIGLLISYQIRVHQLPSEQVLRNMLLCGL